MVEQDPFIASRFKDEPIVGDIVLALDRLCIANDFERISVSMVCAEAGISRTTFYRYFDSKEAVANRMTKLACEYGVARCGRDLTWSQGIGITLRIILRLRPYFQKGSTSLKSLLGYYTEYLTEQYIQTITRHRRMPLDEGLEFAVRAWSYELIGILVWWTMSGFALPVDKMTQYLEQSIPMALAEALKMPGPCADVPEE